MKRTIYIPYFSDGDPVNSPETALNQTCFVARDEKPDLPYIEIEMKVVYHEPRYISARSLFAEKIGAGIIIPKSFTE